MSMQIDHSKPLDAETKKWLHEWSMDYVIEENERIHGKQEGGEPPNVQKALEEAGFQAPPPPPGPTTVAGQGTVATGPVIVEGENDLPPEPGSIGTRVELPRDHALTGVIAEDQGLTDPRVIAETGVGAQPQPNDDGGQVEPQTKDDGKFDTRAVRAEVNELSVDELKDNLRELEEPVSGNKDELRDRLVKALKKAHEAEKAAAE